MPFVFFFKYLAKKPPSNIDGNPVKESTINRLKLWIPDTIVLHEKDLPAMWFYSSLDGFVYRTDIEPVHYMKVVSKLSNYASPDELVAVFKKVSFFE